MSEALLTREETLASLQQARQRLLSTIEGLDEGEMTGQPVVGQWTIRDLMAHILSWEEVAVQRLALIGAGRAAEIEWVPADQVDAWNARAFEAGRSLALGQVLRRLDDIHQRLLKGIESVTEERLNLADAAAGRRWLPHCTYLHEEEHAAQIAEWRREVETSET